MQRPYVPILVILAIMSAFSAYTIMATLIRDFGMDVTWIDLGSIFVLGLISGIGLGLALRLRRRKEVA
ncbi:MAG: hypothetical protein M8467_14845 [Anaerolineae bacterium]|nr:hypothetical protein [Anaerolineae bacterium]